MIYQRIDMSLLAILLFAWTTWLSLWATMRVRQVYAEFSQLPASSGLALLEYYILFFVIVKSIRHADDCVMTNEMETTKLHKQNKAQYYDSLY